MKAFSQFMFAAALVGSLAACAGGSGESESSGPTYSEAEIQSDLDGLNGKEKALEQVGLKFKTSYDYQTGTTTIISTWDKYFLNTWITRNSSLGDTEYVAKVKPALTSYIEAGDAFIKKYGQKFTMGENSQYSLRESVKEEIRSKVDLARKTHEGLK